MQRRHAAADGVDGGGDVVPRVLPERKETNPNRKLSINPLDELDSTVSFKVDAKARTALVASFEADADQLR